MHRHSDRLRSPDPAHQRDTKAAAGIASRKWIATVSLIVPRSPADVMTHPLAPRVIRCRQPPAPRRSKKRRRRPSRRRRETTVVERRDKPQQQLGEAACGAGRRTDKDLRPGSGIGYGARAILEERPLAWVRTGDLIPGEGRRRVGDDDWARAEDLILLKRLGRSGEGLSSCAGKDSLNSPRLCCQLSLSRLSATRKSMRRALLIRQHGADARSLKQASCGPTRAVATLGTIASGADEPPLSNWDRLVFRDTNVQSTVYKR
jgi:hypothetical protein